MLGIDKIKKLFIKTEADVSRELGKLGVNVVQDGVLKYRVTVVQSILEELHSIDDPMKKVETFERLVQAAAVPWQRAKNSSAAAKMLIDWARLLSSAKWLAMLWDEVGAESTQEGRSIKNNLNSAIHKVLDRGFNAVLNTSFSNEDVSPQFIAVLKQEGALPMVGPSPKVQPMFVSEVGGVEK